MAKKNSLKEAPYLTFDKYGRDVEGNEIVTTHRELLSYPQYQRDKVEWVPNEPFFRVLSLVGASRGRSSAIFEWRDIDGVTYPMFLSSMEDLIKNSLVNYGLVSGDWIVVKKGTNYGIERYSY